MKKRFASLTLVIFSLCLSGCGFFSGGGGQDQLYYSTAWSHDENYHWHACITAGHSGEYKDKEAHDFERTVYEPDYGMEGFTEVRCKVCGYSYNTDYVSELTHHFSDEYSYDNLYHWHQCTDPGFEYLEDDPEEHSFKTIVQEATDYKMSYIKEVCDCGFVKSATYGNPITYTITWATEDGTVLYQDVLANKGTTPKYNGPEFGYGVDGDPKTYKFVGWDKPITPVDGNKTYIARFEAVRNKYNVTYLGKDDAVIYEAATDSFEEAFKYLNYDLSSYVKDDVQYNFGGWEKFSDDGNGLITYKAKYEGGTVGLYIYGSVVSYYDGTTEELEIPSTWIGNDVKEIGSGAFKGNESITKITLPEGIEKIGKNAFQGCSRLSEINIPSTVTEIGSEAFSDCLQLKKITIPEGVKEISSKVFYNCKVLKEINIGDGVEEVSSNAFANCISLKSIKLPNTVTYIEAGAFKGCTALELMEIPFVGTFEGDTLPFGCIFGTATSGYIRQANKYNYGIPETIETIIVDRGSLPQYAFHNMVSLKNVVINNEIETIGSDAFTNTSLKSLALPSGIKEIKDGGADYFKDLECYEEGGCLYISTSENKYEYFFGVKDKTVTDCSINSNCKLIRKGALESSSVENLSIPFIGESAGSSQPLSYILGYGGSSLKTITVGDKQGELIPSRAFYGLSNVTTITLPNGIKEIGSKAFENCSKLISINIPNALEKLGEYAFDGCTSLVGTTVGNANYVGNSTNPHLVLVSSNVKSSNKTITVEEGCKFISTSIFKSGENVCNALGISSTVSSISILGLKRSTSLSSMSIAKGNTVYAVNNYSLYSKDLKTLLWFSRDYSDVTSKYLQGVETIGEYAFNSCSKIKKITIPNNVKKIESGAFFGCSNIEEMTVPFFGTDAENGDIYSIFGTTKPYSFSKITINEDVRSLYLNTTNDNSIATLVLPSSLRTFDIEKSSLNSVTSIEFSGDNYHFNISNGMLINEADSKVVMCLKNTSGVVEIPSDIKSIGNYAFASCKSITGFTFHEGLETVGKNAFASCALLTALNLPTSVSSLGESALYNCGKITEVAVPYTEDENHTDFSFYFGSSRITSLKNVVFTRNIKQVDKNYFAAFASYIETLNLPASVESIDYQSLKNWSKLKSIEIDKNNENYSSYCGVLYNKDKTEILCCPKDFVGDLSLSEHLVEVVNGELENHSKITSLKLENADTYIGDGALRGCDALNLTEYSGALYLGTKQNPYLYLVKVSDKALDECEIHSSCKYILDNAFNECVCLEKVIIPSNVVHIGEKAFYGCLSVKNIDFSKASSLESIGAEAFKDCVLVKTVVVPDSVLTLGNGIFKGCTSLTTLTLPFAGTSSTEGSVALLFTDANGYSRAIPDLLKTIIISDKYTTIHKSAFSNLSGVETIILPDNIVIIEESAFSNCTELKELTMGDSVEYIGIRAFAGCTSLETLRVPFIGETRNENTYIGYWFDSSSQTIKNRDVSRSLKTIILSENYTEIPDQAFLWCYYIENVTLSKNTTRIGERAFEGCGKLKDIKLGDKLEYIGSSAFSGCSSFTSIYVPDSVTYIGQGAFSGNNNVETVRIPFIGTTVDDIENNITYIYGYVNAFNDVPYRTYILGDKAKVIGPKAFDYYSRASKIILPDSLETIDDQAFFGVYNLEYSEYKSIYYLGNENNPYLCAVRSEDLSAENIEIHKDCKFVIMDTVYSIDNSTLTIPSNVRYISIGFLSSNFKAFNVDVNSSYYSSDNGVLYNKNKTSLIKCPSRHDGSYSTLSSTKRIENYAFFECNYLENLVLNEGVEYFGFKAFDGLNDFEEFAIPSSVKEIVPGAFSECNFGKITVSKSNATYVDVDNAVYTKDLKTLVFAAAGYERKFTILDSVETILDYSMNGFACDAVILGKNVKYIGTYALNTGNVQFITFLGTYEEWDNIDKQIDFATEDIFLVSCSDRDATFDYTLYSSWYLLF